MRGKLSNSGMALGLCRITPAGAGKTPRQAYLSVSAPDHPRRCGENVVFSSCCAPRLGSPPQVRGKLARKIAGYARSRITPAGAGKTTAPGEGSVVT